MRAEECTFLIQEKLVQLRDHVLSATIQSQLSVNNVDKCIDADVPRWILECELAWVQLEAVSYFSIDDSLATFAKWTLATFAD